MAADPVDQQLAGRARELEALRVLARAAAGGRAGTLLISGEAGVGKTALVRDLCRHVGTGTDVLWAGCLPLSSLVSPLLPLSSASRDWAAGRDAPGPDLGAGPAGLDRWLDDACRRRPVLLVVDDLHWADRSTLDMLMYLIAGPAQRRLAVVGTLRPGNAGTNPALRRWLADVRRLPLVGELVVGPLDRRSTGLQLAGLLGRQPHESLVDDVFARTRGNAYLTVLLARGLSPDAIAVPAELPGDLRDAVSHAWYGLSAETREVTRVIAVGARPQRAAQVAAVLDDHEELVPRLREAVDGGVLEVRGGDRYWFVHPLLAEVLEQSMLPEERQRWHAVFAATLEPAADRTAEAELVIELADHHHRAGHVEQAYVWALRAADAAAGAGGAAESTRLLYRALDLRPQVPDPGVTEVDLLLRIKAAAERAGLHAEELTAVELLLATVDGARRPLLAAGLLVRRGHLRFLAGTEFLVVEHMREAVRLASADRDSPEYVLATAELAHAELWHGEPGGPARARAAVRLARACRSGHALAYALVAEVMAACLRPETRDLDELPDSQEQATEARLAAARAPDFLAFVHAALWGGNCMDHLHADEVIAHYRRCREELVRLNAPHAYVAWLASVEAAALLYRGDQRACRDRLRVALGADPGRRAGTEARLTAALLACRQGRPGEAADHLARAEELCDEQSGFLVSTFDAVRAELAVAAADPRGAVAAARAGLGQDLPPTFVERLLPLAARALADEIQRGRDRGIEPPTAMAELIELRRAHPAVVADFGPGPLARSLVRAMQAWYDAEYARALRDPGIVEAWSRAATECRAAKLAWDEAYAQWRTAEAALPERSTRARGRSALRRAYELAVALDAVPLLDEVTALADAVRLTPASESIDVSPAPVLRNLTPREREIVALVAAGHTYAEIARALVISEKTVSSHISHILDKTGLANRVQLAQLARRRQRDVPPAEVRRHRRDAPGS